MQAGLHPPVTSQTTAAVSTRSRTAGPAADDAVDAQALFSALDDADCRALLAATADEARSASELSERCDLPTSTTYRKLDRLTEAGLLESGVRIHPEGHHTSEYRLACDDVVVGLGDDGVAVELLETRDGREREQRPRRQTA